MNKIGELFATYEAELREIADQHGGQVDVYRPGNNVIALPLPPPTEHQEATAEQEEWAEVIDADFAVIEPGEEDTIH